MFKTLVSYIWKPENVSDDNLTLDEAFATLQTQNEEENVDVDNEAIQVSNDDTSCYRKEGIITTAEKGAYTIDNLYEFKTDDLSIQIGSKICYTCHKNNHNTLVISNVQIINDEWDNFTVSNKGQWCTRTIVCEVDKREGRLLYLKPGDIKIDLNVVSSEFIPIEGDWVAIEVKCEIEETVTNLSGKILEVNTVSPIRPKIIEGIVRDWDLQTYTGIINRNAFFNRDSLSNGYLPKKGDKVVAEIIESNQGTCSWRALKVVTHSSCPKTDTFNDVKLPKTTDFQDNELDVQVTNDICIYNTNFNEISKFTIMIENNKVVAIELLDIIFDSNHSQIKLDSPSTFSKKILESSECLNIEFITTSKMIGTVKELIIFVFNTFKIGRYITINLKSQTHTTYQRYNNRSNVNFLKNHRSQSDMELIKGQKTIVPPRFISNRLPEYKVPDKIWNVFLHSDNRKKMNEFMVDLMHAKPCLQQVLSYKCYEERFHTLLFLEEIEDVISIRKYDQDRACFIRNGEYLMLEIENLSEKKPSIVIGDKVIAENPYKSDGQIFEGFVHKVSAKHVYLKFSSLLHDVYKGEDYSVHVIQSRTKVRKLHQAVGLAILNLGRNFLFPTQVHLKPPQTNFTYEHYDDIIHNTHKKIMNRSSKKKTNRQLLEIIKSYNSSDNESVCESVPIIESDTLTDVTKTKLILQPTEDEILNKKVRRHNKKADENAINDRQFKLEWYDPSLNYFQKEAVRNILLGEARPLPYFIFGPPGTGKTVTLIETILQLLRMLPHSRLLVATPSNSAADLIALRLIDSGCIQPGDLVRFVSFKSASDDSIPLKLIPYSCTANLAREGTTNDTPIVTNSGLTIGCGSSVIGRHRVTIGTCSTLGTLYSMGFPKGHFSHVIIDEAGQTSEPESMIPLVFLDISEGQAILAGDPMQLGPVVSSIEAKQFGFGEPLLERLIHRFPYSKDLLGFPKTFGYDPRLVTRLIYNYRSLPGILQLPNQLFYHSELKPTICENTSIEAMFLNKFSELLPNQNGKTCMAFHGIDGHNYQSADSPSWFNPDEASQVFYYVNEFYRLGAKSTDIGIITPYLKQVKQIRELFREAEFDIPKIGTVEEFQGQECNIIIISTVRSTVEYVQSDLRQHIGFIANPRRINVAITRAQCLCLIIGNPNLLGTDSNWRNVLNHCVENGSYIGCALPSNY